MAKAFAEAGMQVALADIDASQLEQARQDLAAQGIEALTLPLDTTNREAVKAAAARTAEHFGGLHVVCANAGVSGHMGPLQEARDEDWDWVLDVNLKGTINTIQACLPHLHQAGEGGHIVLTASISGLRVYRPSRGQGMYNTTKFAMVGLGEALCLDLEPEGIDVSIVCPGVVNTQISHSGRHRQAKYGGTKELDPEHELAKAASSGTDPYVFGQWVLKGMGRRQLFIITHDEDRELVEERHRRIMGAFDTCPELTR